MKLPYFSLTFLLFVVIQTSCHGQVRSSGVSCTQAWKKYSDGLFDDNAVEIGSGELVVRVQVAGNWIPGRLSAIDKKAYIPTGSGSVEFTEYEVLLGTAGCRTEWVPVEAGDDLSLIYAVDAGSGAFVGRGEHDGYILGGSAINGGSMKVAYAGASHPVESAFEVLVSSYPALDAEVSDYTFHEDDLVDLEAKGALKLISMEQMESTSADILSAKHFIQHEQSIEEFFEVDEKQSWNGVQTVAQTLLLWFGSPIVTGQFDVTGTKTITTNRNRVLQVSKELTISNMSNINVCSYAFMVTTDTKIRYSAIGKFVGDQMSGEQVKTVLTSTGRPGSIVHGISARVNVEGTISGKFALRIISRIEDNDGSGAPCLVYSAEFNRGQDLKRAFYV